jgi:hypothetical protein
MRCVVMVKWNALIYTGALVSFRFFFFWKIGYDQRWKV